LGLARLLGGGFFGAGLLALGGLLGRFCAALRSFALARSFLLGGLLLGYGAAFTALLQEFRGAFRGDVFEGITFAERSVGLAVGDVQSEPAFTHRHLTATHRIVTEGFERRGGFTLTALLG